MPTKSGSNWQTSGTPQDASRYQETLLRVRRLAPFVELLPNGGSPHWSFLSERHRSGAAEPEQPQATADALPPTLLLSTLFGHDLYGSLAGLELQGRAPATTAALPTRVLSACVTPIADVALTQYRADDADFAEKLSAGALTLVWECARCLSNLTPATVASPPHRTARAASQVVSA